MRKALLALPFLLTACGGGSSSPPPAPPAPPPLPAVASIADGCAQAATYLNTLRYTSKDPATVGYSIMLQEYCAGSTTTGLPTSPDATVIAYLQNLVADGNAFTAGGNDPSLLVIPAISTF